MEERANEFPISFGGGYLQCPREGLNSNNSYFSEEYQESPIGYGLNLKNLIKVEEKKYLKMKSFDESVIKLRRTPLRL